MVPIKYKWGNLAIALYPTTFIWESLDMKDVVLQQDMVGWASYFSFTILPSVFSVSVLKSSMGFTLTPASCIQIVSVIKLKYKERWTSKVPQLTTPAWNYIPHNHSWMYQPQEVQHPQQKWASKSFAGTAISLEHTGLATSSCSE